MKLLAIELSRLTVLTYASRLSGQLYLPSALTAFLDKYQFLGRPHDLLKVTGDKMEFKHGTFQDAAIESLDVYNDGLVISSRSSTDVLDKFFEDISDFMRDEWSVSFVKSQTVDRMYESTLLVSTEKDILKPLSAFDAISSAINGYLFETIGFSTKYEPFGFTLSADQAKIATLKPGIFRLERRIGIEYEFDQYVSTAPLRTNDHFELLRKCEELL